jgi:hypothetical protein
MPAAPSRHLPVLFAVAAALSARASFAQNRPAAQSAAALCRQGDEEQHADHLTEARQHLEQGLALLGTTATPAARRQRLQCSSTLASVLFAQGDREAAWTRALRGWEDARSLPPSQWAGFEPSFFDYARQRYSGARCTEGLADVALEDAEVTALQYLARFESQPVRECLTAVRARLAQTQRGTCRVLTSLPNDTPAFAPAERSWTSVDAQTGVRVTDGGVLVARVNGANTRYVSCNAGFTEAQATPAAQWVVPGAVLAVTLRIIPCGEDTSARCPPERLAYMLDASGQLLGMYTLQRSSLVDRGPTALPFGTVTAASPFTADGAAIRIGTRRLAVSQGALAAAP